MGPEEQTRRGRTDKRSSIKCINEDRRKVDGLKIIKIKIKHHSNMMIMIRAIWEKSAWKNNQIKRQRNY